jgi:Protein of unknown function (DUF1254)
VRRARRKITAVGVLLASAIFATLVQAQDSVPVTIDNFAHAESDLYFGKAVKEAGGIGKFFHNRTPTEIDKQLVIRMNRDTLYSSAAFDLDAGPVTITLPNSGKRFMSLQVISEDHYAPMVVYAPNEVTLTKENVGTRYVMAAVRTLVDPNNTNDLKEVAALQDAIKVSQPVGLESSRCRTGIRSNKKKFATPCWCSQNTIVDLTTRWAPEARSIRSAT